MKAITLTVNGKRLAAAVEPRTHLADFLRETQGLTGTHLGCEHGICGACTLLLDGVPVRSCITYAIACDGASVTTIEGLDDDEIAKELRQAFSREHALQCGYCTPGVLISARDLAVRSDRADERDIRIAMSGIAAIPDAGRRTMGPAGSGHAKTAGPSNVQPSGATTARTPPPRVTAETEPATGWLQKLFRR